MREESFSSQCVIIRQSCLNVVHWLINTAAKYEMRPTKREREGRFFIIPQMTLIINWVECWKKECSIRVKDLPALHIPYTCTFVALLLSTVSKLYIIRLEIQSTSTILSQIDDTLMIHEQAAPQQSTVTWRAFFSLRLPAEYLVMIYVAAFLFYLFFHLKGLILWGNVWWNVQFWVYFYSIWC